MLQSAIGVVKKNSLEYVEFVFNALAARQTVISLSEVDEQISLDEFELTERLLPEDKTGWYQGPAYQPADSADLAQVAFSSGTEGKPKAICISHAALANTTERLTQVMEIDESIREYVGVPVSFSFGFGRCRVVSAAGGQFFLPKNGFDPLEIRDMLREGQINAISAVPTLWRLVLENPDVLADVGDKVRWIEIGSQYMAADEKAAMRKLFPHARIVQHYGLTEASRTTFLRVDEATEEQLASVGKALYGVEVKVGENGSILIRGPHVATKLYQDGQARSVTGEDGWLATNDKGHMVGDSLVFEGRMDDLINCGGIKLSPERLDQQLRQELGVGQGIHTVKVQDARLGETLGITALDGIGIEAERIKEAAAAILSGYGVNLGSSLALSFVPEFPVTSTGKLRRKELSEWLSSENAASAGHKQPTAERGELSGEALLASVFHDVLGEREVSPSASLRTLGADSLSIVQLRVALSKHISQLPDDWIDLPVTELAKSLDPSEGTPSSIWSSLGRLESYIPMRAIAICLVVLHHYTGASMTHGATTLLFVVSGYLFFSAHSLTIEKGTHLGRLWLGLVVLAFTVAPVVAVQAVVHGHVGNDWHPTLLLPYENVVSYFNDLLRIVDTKHHVHWLWFIHAYLQMFLIIGLAFSIKRVREFLARDLFKSLFVAFFATEALAVALIFADSGRQDVFHSAALLQYSPTTLLPVVLFGGMMALAESATQRHKLLLAAATYTALHLSGIFTQGGFNTLLGVVVLFLWPVVSLPRVLHRPLMVLAESSLFIYLTHMPIKFALFKVSPVQPSATAAALLAIVVGALAWPIWSALVVDRVRRLKAFH